jgi:DNA-binding transcriptional regulator of glucitol operon
MKLILILMMVQFFATQVALGVWLWQMYKEQMTGNEILKEILKNIKK